MPQTRETREAAHPAILAVGCRPDVMIWKQPVGVFRAIENPERVVSVGERGQSDSIAVVAVTITAEMVGKTIGAAVAPEFKTARRGRLRAGTQSEDQKNWQAAFEARGGAYRLIRSAEEMLQFVEDVQSGKTLR